MLALCTRAVLVQPLVVGMAAVSLLGLSSGLAQTPRSRAQVPAEASRGANTDVRDQRGQELEAVRAEQRQILEREASLKHEIELIGDDRRKFNQQIIDVAAHVVSLEERIAKGHERLVPLDERERTMRESLEQRRELIGELLASLQRIGRHAPPALLVRAEDALAAVRSAIMLGAVLPEMRGQVDTLVADLADLVRVRKEVTAERDALARDLLVQADEHRRLAAFVEERQRRQAEVEQALTEDRQRSTELARHAENLNQLIAKLESAARARAAEERRPEGRPDLAALRDPGRLVPAIAFGAAKGLLPLPLNGARVKEFGAADGLGGKEKGLSIAARPGGQITSPCDGWVVYAGAFRNYGQLLILNVGGGYHVLLAGMERISVDLGQFVVTGEPVAVMGGGAQAAAVMAGGVTQPVLYVEFRKDGAPIDPGPWWAVNEGQKVRG
ncbi:MAG: murein hydrolase activator EnvC family protein [Xanthobacteraceae bacterium]